MCRILAASGAARFSHAFPLKAPIMQILDRRLDRRLVRHLKTERGGFLDEQEAYHPQPVNTARSRRVSASLRASRQGNHRGGAVWNWFGQSLLTKPKLVQRSCKCAAGSVSAIAASKSSSYESDGFGFWVLEFASKATKFNDNDGTRRWMRDDEKSARLKVRSSGTL